jgi:tripartite-type tricarboxylate transporter receptor subunit TctC
MPGKRRRISILACAVVATGLFPALSSAARAQSADDFFKKVGRLTMYVGSGAGGGYDEIARFVAIHLSRFIPGHPSIVVDDMPGAGGVVATNFVYNSAPRDGSVLLAGTSSSLGLPIYNSPVTHYDPRKFAWIGSTGKQQAICVAWKTTGVKTLDDAKRRVVTVSATAINEEPGAYPMMLNAMLGTKFKVISGYSTGGMPLAVEQGEVQGLCGYAWQTYQAIGSKWFVDKKVNILVQMGLEKNIDLPDVPLADSLVKNPDDKKVLDQVVLPDEIGRPFMAPPGTPSDRMAVYRRAFQAMLKDPQFLAEAKRLRIAIDPLDDAQIEALFAQAYAAPKAIHDSAATFAAQMD